MSGVEPKVVGCTCDFSQGTRGMDRCHRCDGTGSRFLVFINGEGWYYPNTREGYVEAMQKLGLTPEPEEAL